MKNNIQKQIYVETEHMSDKELLHYFNNNKKYKKHRIDSDESQAKIINNPISP